MRVPRDGTWMVEFLLTLVVVVEEGITEASSVYVGRLQWLNWYSWTDVSKDASRLYYRRSKGLIAVEMPLVHYFYLSISILQW